MDPSTPPHIREWDVLVTYRLNFSYISLFYNTHYEMQCPPGFLDLIYMIGPAYITLYDNSQIFATASFRNLLVPKGII